MSKEKKNMVVPKLRFPEFLEADDWKTAPLGDIYSFISTNSFTRDDLNYENGTVKNIHYGDIHTKFATLFDVTKEIVPFINSFISLEKISADAYCREGDLIFADASEDLKDVGKSIEIFFLNYEKVLAGMHTLQARQKEKKLAVGFGGHLFMSEDIRKQIQREAQGAKVLGVSATRLSNTIIFYPKNKIEQQKIASCLSSLDVLITAHTQKLDALKAHKKGMMQQLFPDEEEKVPKLRYNEFKDSVEWRTDTIGNLCESYSGGTPLTTKKEFYGGDIPFIRSAEISKDKTELFLTVEGLKNSSAKLVNVGDILVALYGANSGDVAISKINGAINQAILCLNSKNSNGYVYHFLSYKKDWIVRKYIQGGQGNLSGEIVKSIPIPFSNPEEQQKIASCLSSLDELITAQAEKIEQLKMHKKGLMQGLFPKITN